MGKQRNTSAQEPHPTMGATWLRLTNDIISLMKPRKGNRPLDQYLVFRDKVFVMVQDDKFIKELDSAFEGDDAVTTIGKEVAHLLQFEMESCSRAIEVAHAIEKTKKKGWRERLLGHASTVVGSVKDIGETTLSPYAKNGIILFKEAVDIFKKQ